jgi:hypothetical protein
MEGFFSSFFADRKNILYKIDPTEKLESMGNTLKGFAGNAKDAIGDVVNDAGDWLDDTFGCSFFYKKFTHARVFIVNAFCLILKYYFFLDIFRGYILFFIEWRFGMGEFIVIIMIVEVQVYQLFVIICCILSKL